jgi:hypothetical protein
MKPTGNLSPKTHDGKQKEGFECAVLWPKTNMKRRILAGYMGSIKKDQRKGNRADANKRNIAA